jgi:hypothetical protein
MTVILALDATEEIKLPPMKQGRCHHGFLRDRRGIVAPADAKTAAIPDTSRQPAARLP